MTRVGIIANPAAGKDIRRLVAHASVFDNNEKVNIVRRVLLGLDATGIEEVVFMPDYYAIGARALENLDLSLHPLFLDMSTEFNQTDSTLAAQLMLEMGVGCIVTLGGDGTNRAVAKGCGSVPLMPISTGTNNVFPQMIEGTIAGLAAGVVVSGIVPAIQVLQSNPRLEILRDGEVCDIALVDAVVYDDPFVGSRAIWDESKIQQLVLAKAEPYNVGLSSIGGNLNLCMPNPGQGLALEMGGNGLRVLSPISPGLIRWVNISSYNTLNEGESVAVNCTPGIIGLDGERELTLSVGENVRIRLSNSGPKVIDVQAALREAANVGFFCKSR